MIRDEDENKGSSRRKVAEIRHNNICVYQAEGVVSVKCAVKQLKNYNKQDRTARPWETSSRPEVEVGKVNDPDGEKLQGQKLPESFQYIFSTSFAPFSASLQ